MASPRDPQVINNEYGNLCAQLGELEYRQEKTKDAMYDIRQKISALMVEMPKAQEHKKKMDEEAKKKAEVLPPVTPPQN